MSVPGDSVVMNLPVNAEDVGLILGLGRSSGEGNGNPLQCSCLENPRDWGAWWAAVYGVTQSDTTEATWLQQHGGLVTNSSLTFFEPMNFSLPGSSVHVNSQAKIQEWVAISFSRGPA